MAVIKQGILGGLSGKIGNVVGSSWKGIAVLKSLPLSVANPKSPGQVAQRNRFTGCVEAARILLAALIQTYWNPFAQRMSGYNMFVSENVETFDGGIFTDFAAFFATRGSLLGITSTGASASAAGNSITVPWTDNSGQADALATDEVIVTAYNDTQDYWIVDAGSVTRNAETITITDNLVAASDELKIYLSVSRPDVSKVSDSTYSAITAGA